MLLSTTTSLMSGHLPLDKTVSIIKNAGFDAYDMSFYALPDEHYLYSNERISKAKELRAFSDELGIVCNQAHAPFPSSSTDQTQDGKLFDNIVKSMEVASILGAGIIVVHPKQHLIHAEHQRELFEMNVEFYGKLLPYAEDLGIKIAAENMWQGNNSSMSIIDSTCSRAWEFNEYIDALSSPYLVGCLDLGHVGLVGADICKMIEQMGSKRIKALHVHDNDNRSDCHTMPYASNGVMNWDAITATLGKIGYDGDLTYEADGFLSRFPTELFEDGERLMHAVGRHLIKKIIGA